MAWSPPVGSAALSLRGTPGGTSLHLAKDLEALVAAHTAAPSASAQLQIRYPARVAAHTAAPTAAAHVGIVQNVAASIAAQTAAPQAAGVVAHPPLSLLHLRAETGGGALHLGLEVPANPRIAAITAPPQAAIALSARIRAAIAAQTQAPTASGRVAQVEGVRAEAHTAPPQAAGRIAPVIGLTAAAFTAAPSAAAICVRSAVAQGAAQTASPTAHAPIAYDPNLISAVTAHLSSAWRAATTLEQGARDPIHPAPLALGAGVAPWRPAPSTSNGARERWRAAAPALGEGRSAWRAGAWLGAGERAVWRAAASALMGAASAWRDGELLGADFTAHWVNLPLVVGGILTRFRDGRTESQRLGLAWQDGMQRRCPTLVKWKAHAGYCANTKRRKPPKPPKPPPSWNLHLCLWRPLPGSTLSLGLPICWGGRCQIPPRRIYRVRNSAYLVRLPERTPLPVTALSVGTDADSWCWALSASLAGPQAYALVAPQPPAFLPREVEAGINGYVWRFLLDQPGATWKFGSTSASLKGRSRSAWLAAPYAAGASGSEAEPRTANQIADAALEDSGWTLIWDLPDWLVPGGVYSWSGTPIERVAAMLKPVDGCLYTDPWELYLTASLRYPTPSWGWEAETADLQIPRGVILNLERAPDVRPLYNGVWVSGTKAGVLARCFVSGSAGDLLAPMVTDPLICDSDGVAARARGVAVLSASGPGATLSVRTPLLRLGDLVGTGCGLVRPGMLLDIAGLKARARTVRIEARWSGGGLQVAQQIGAERREVEV